MKSIICVIFVFCAYFTHTAFLIRQYLLCTKPMLGNGGSGVSDTSDGYVKIYRIG